MPKVEYTPKKFTAAHEAKITHANKIIAEYDALGLSLTLRQLYYQFVSRNLIANNDREYKNLSAVITAARRAGRVDWRALEDRTRFLRSNSHWDSPADIMRSAASSFALDKWQDQPVRFEVWVEKDALVGVLDGVCNELDVPYFSCRGYASDPEVWLASQRFIRHVKGGQEVHLIHLGDHDPSGIDMTRDIEARLLLYFSTFPRATGKFRLTRIALNRDQIDEYEPPPNPAKISDPRATGYIQEHGDTSWELDALDPTRLAELIRETVESERDDSLWQEATDREANERRDLERAADDWQDIGELLDTRANLAPDRLREIVTEVAYDVLTVNADKKTKVSLEAQDRLVERLIEKLRRKPTGDE